MCVLHDVKECTYNIILCCHAATIDCFLSKNGFLVAFFTVSYDHTHTHQHMHLRLVISTYVI